MRWRDGILTGWGNYPKERCRVARPERGRELVQAVTSGEVAHVLSRGLGRGYGDSALDGGGGIILHERLNRFLSFDPATGLVEAEAGVSYEDLLAVCLPLGFFPPVTPGTKFVTLGGAVAADVHGKNHHRDGSVAEFLESLAVVVADGRRVTCSRQESPELFWATVGGMGLTGAIETVKLRLLPVESGYLRVRYQRSANLDETLERFAEGDAQYRYSVCWIDCLASGRNLGRSVLMRGDHARASEISGGRAPLLIPSKRPLGVPCNAPSLTLNPLTVGLFNQTYYRVHPKDAERIVDYDSYFYPLDRILHWNRLYGRQGFVQFQALLPFETSRRGLVTLLEKLSASRRPSFLAVLKTMGKPSGGLLSFPREGHTLTLDIPRPGPSLAAFLEDLTAVVLNCGGRVYLAKDAHLGKEAFREMYPSASRFLEVKRRFDPAFRFQSTLARRVGLLGGA